jgi:hypothetical protein
MGPRGADGALQSRAVAAPRLPSLGRHLAAVALGAALRGVTRRGGRVGR